MISKAQFSRKAGNWLETRLPSQFREGRYADREWHTKRGSDAGRTIRWDATQLSPGVRLGDAKCRKLLLGSKRLVYLELSRARQRQLKPQTILQFRESIVALSKWMVARGLYSFSELDARALKSYADFVRTRTPNNRETNICISAGRQRLLLKPAGLLCKFRNDMGTLGISLNKRDSDEVLRELRKLTGLSGKLKALSDATFFSLFNCAKRCIAQWPTTLAIFKAYVAYKAYHNNSAHVRRSNRFSDFAKARLAKFPALTIDGVVKRPEQITIHELARLATIVRGACFVVIAAFVGMRESEICSLRVGCLRAESPGKGRQRVLRISGTLYKTVAPLKGVPANWVAGYAGSDNPVAAAVRTLESFPRDPGNDHLFAPMFVQTTQKTGARIAKGQVRKALGLFVAVAGVQEKVSPHRFRKSFARYAARASGVSPVDIMRHYKHLSILMTERYLPDDPELMDEIFEESQQLIAERLDAIFSATKLGGIGGAAIVARNHRFRGEANAAARKELVDLTMTDPQSYFKPTPYGMCIYEAEIAKCGGNLSKVGLDTCVGCSNFVVESGANGEFWAMYERSIDGAASARANIGICDPELARSKGIAERILGQIGRRGRTH